MFYSTQGNQVAIKKIKNHISCNFQKPSIVAEFNVVKFKFLDFFFILLYSDNKQKVKHVFTLCNPF